VTEGQGGPIGPMAPWAAALDPVANLRALGDIPRQGLLAAGEIIERLTTLVDGQGGAIGGQAGADGRTVGGAAEQWGELARAWLLGMARLAGNGPNAAPVPVAPAPVPAGAARPAADVLRLSLRPPGSASAVVWLHNGTPVDQRGLRPHCGELRAENGGTLRVALRFEPAVVERLAAGASCGVEVTAGAGEVDGAGVGVATGTYRGLILVAGQPDTWLPIEVTIGA
jgi:hypothetical protein